jgi:two-component system, NarL family, sensor histidine kinase DesK
LRSTVTTVRIDPVKLGLAYEEERRQRSINRWRRPGVFFLFYLIYAIRDLVQNNSWMGSAFGLALIAVFCGIYVVQVPKAGFGGTRNERVFVLASMTSILVVYGFIFGSGMLVLMAYFSVAVAMCVPVRWGLAWIIAILPTAIFVPEHISSWGLEGYQFSLGAAVSLGGLATLGVRKSVRDNVELAETRQQLEEMAASQERQRIARDLHDLLGHALTTVIVKAELASKLASRDPDRAAQEMNEVAELARQGLADVRSTVTGYRSVNLVTELATAREVLRSAGIAYDIPTAADVVPPTLHELFGWTLREGVTNTVRHSGAAFVAVKLTPTSIEIADNGHGFEGGVGGNGLTGLRERVASANGTVTADNVSSGGFSLKVEVP